MTIGSDMAERLAECLASCRFDTEHKALLFNPHAKVVEVQNFPLGIPAASAEDRCEEKSASADSKANDTANFEGKVSPNYALSKLACIPLIENRNLLSDGVYGLCLDIREEQWNILLRDLGLAAVRRQAHTNPSIISVIPHLKDGEIVGLSYSFYVSRFFGIYYVFNAGKGAHGNGIVWGDSEFFKPLQLALSHLKHLEYGPFCLFLATIITIVSMVDQRLNDSHHRIARVEMRTGMHEWTKNVYSAAEGPLAELQARMCGIEIKNASNRRLTALALEMIRAVKEDVLDDKRTSSALLPSPIDTLSEGLIFYERRLQEQLNTTQYLHDRAQIQMAALLNMKNEHQMGLSQNIAHTSLETALATKRDSTSMKILAAMTVLFLPGTFIASLLSTSMFEWRFDEGAIVSSQFWCYWAITLPLTLVVMSAAYLWSHWAAKAAKRQDCDDVEKLDEAFQKPAYRVSSAIARLSPTSTRLGQLLGEK